MEKFLTFAEISEILGISKTRLYELIRQGIFPEPQRNASNNRPLFNSDLTERCRQVLKTRIGVNGQPYTPNRKRKSPAAAQRGRHESLVGHLSSLGITATSKQVDDAIKSLPEGGKGLDEGDLVKQVFLRLRQQP
jgi:hypothetical protein